MLAANSSFCVVVSNFLSAKRLVKIFRMYRKLHFPGHRYLLRHVVESRCCFVICDELLSVVFPGIIVCLTFTQNVLNVQDTQLLCTQHSRYTTFTG